MSFYKYFCSLGLMCHTARMMQRLHIKTESYPFDWVFSDDKIIIDAIEDDFKKFMDPTYYIEPKTKFTERQCGHSIYHPDFFFHKNPKNKYDYDYYERCITRFRKMIKSSEKKLFIHMYTPQNTTHPMDVYNMLNVNTKEQIINELKNRGRNLNNILSKHTNNYTLLVIINFANNNEQSFVIEFDTNISFITINTLSSSNGVEFGNNCDNLYLSGIIREYFPN